MTAPAEPTIAERLEAEARTWEFPGLPAPVALLMRQAAAALRASLAAEAGLRAQRDQYLAGAEALTRDVIEAETELRRRETTEAGLRAEVERLTEAKQRWLHATIRRDGEIAQLREELAEGEGYTRAAEQRAVRLAAGLRPFAQHLGDELGPELNDTDVVAIPAGWNPIRVGDFRRARALLAGDSPSLTLPAGERRAMMALFDRDHVISLGSRFSLRKQDDNTWWLQSNGMDTLHIEASVPCGEGGSIDKEIFEFARTAATPAPEREGVARLRAEAEAVCISSPDPRPPGDGVLAATEALTSWADKNGWTNAEWATVGPSGKLFKVSITPERPYVPAPDPRPHIQFRRDALAKASALEGEERASDLTAPDDLAMTLAIVAAGYKWTVHPETGLIVGLVAGDQGYAATDLVVDEATRTALVAGMAKPDPRPDAGMVAALRQVRVFLIEEREDRVFVRIGQFETDVPADSYEGMDLLRFDAAQRAAIQGAVGGAGEPGT